MAELHVTSASNPRLKAVLALRRRRVREEEGLTVVDGFE
jgi:RNA methyltransferase, TrmH family